VFAYDPFTPATHQSATNVVRQAPQQATPQSGSPTMVQRIQSKIDAISDAIGTHDLILPMAETYQDGQEVAITKLHLRSRAVECSEPSTSVKNRGLQWLTIFHALRKDLVSRAIEIEYMPQEAQAQQLELTDAKYPRFSDHVYKDVVEARTVVAKGYYDSPVVQNLWKSNGKKDVLDRVFEKESALHHERVNQRARRRRESITRLSSSETEADMIIKVETSVQQTVERVDPHATAAQPRGVTKTTISGPRGSRRTSVRFAPGVGILRMCDENRREFDLPGMGATDDQLIAEMPVGVDVTLAITIDQRLQPSERVKDYLVALRAVADALFNVEARLNDVEAEYESDESL
jgi:hypothetical protein